nr:hypothetical protein [uncultured Campylobacter sp.]
MTRGQICRSFFVRPLHDPHSKRRHFMLNHCFLPKIAKLSP